MGSDGQIVGAYRLVEQIGAGGMGTVWLAEHTMLGRRAAVKLLHPEYSTRPEIVMRFFNEAKAAAAIHDPGIVQIFDFGKHTDGRVYIVMEVLEGEPLDRRLDRLGRLAVRDALLIVRQVASSLGSAHARGIIHRDLKPENIFLVRDPEVPGGERAKILDFGIAKLAKEQGGVRTNTSALLGTPTYMSPEQCRGAIELDLRSDVYSLGCVLFALLTGEPPFSGIGAGDVIVQHVTVPAPLASSRAPGLPAAVDALVARCLAKSPAERYGSGAELAAAISAVLANPDLPATVVGAMPPRPSTAPTMPGIASTPGSGVAARGRSAAAGAGSGPVVPAVTTLSASSASLVPAPARRGNRAVVFGVIGAVVAIGAAVTIAVVAGGGSDASTTPPATATPGTNDTAGSSSGVTAPAKDPAPDPRATTEPTPAKPAPAIDHAGDTTRRITALAEAFATWARSHAGAPCPTLAELGATGDAALDGWGHPLVVTCREQPAEQRLGIRAPGADGALGTADDVTSWQLEAVATSLAGARWTEAVAAKPRPGATTPTPRPRPNRPRPTPRPSGNLPGDIDGDGIPDTR